MVDSETTFVKGKFSGPNDYWKVVVLLLLLLDHIIACLLMVAYDNIGPCIYILCKMTTVYLIYCCHLQKP